MIPAIRKAVKEEVDLIKDKSDLGPNTGVWIWPNERGDSDIAVIRQCIELDPVHFGASSGGQRKALFFWAMCNMLRAAGNMEVYFDIDAEGTEEYLAILEKMGAVKTTAVPQWRLKMSL